MKKKKVLFISYDGLTDPLGQSQILPYFKGLSALGHEITILSCDKRDAFERHSTMVQKECDAHNIKWEHCFYHKSPPILSTLWDVRNLRRKAIDLNRKYNFDIIHCRSIIATIIGDVLRKNNNAKLIFDIRGFWADERVEGKLWNLNNPIYKAVYRYFKRKEKQLFQSADAIVSLTENAKQHILENFKTKDNFAVIPCCVDLNHFDYQNIDSKEVLELKKELRIKEDDYVLTYLGSLGTRYLLKEMLLFFKQLKTTEPKSKFRFIRNSDTAEITTICANENIDNRDIIITSAAYKEIPKYISLGNASIFFIVSSFSGKAVSPTKQAEVMSLGLPIVTNANLGDTDKIIEKTATGVIQHRYEESEMLENAKKIVAINIPANEIRKVAKEYFSLEIAVERYNLIYQYL